MHLFAFDSFFSTTHLQNHSCKYYLILMTLYSFNHDSLNSVAVNNLFSVERLLKENYRLDSSQFLIIYIKN